MKLLTILWLSLQLTACAVVGAETIKRVTITAYCCCPVCCGKWALESNLRREMLRSGISVAGPRRYPLGTHVWIEGLGERVIQDRTARRYDSRYDLYFTNHQQAAAFGERKLKVILLQLPSHRTPPARVPALADHSNPRPQPKPVLASNAPGRDPLNTRPGRS